MSDVKFGTGGFRGVIGDNFNKENIQRICQAMCNIAERRQYRKEICIGYDNRFMSENFAKWCADVFASNNFRVELFQRASSTPVVMYRCKKQNYDYGIMITASHNPYQYNGIKVFVKEGKDASVEETNEIESEFKTLKHENIVINDKLVDKNIIYCDYIDEFVRSIITNQNIPDCSNLNVVFDSKFGSTVDEINLFAKYANLKNYTIINSTRDAFFNFTTPAPNIDNIEQLKLNVKLANADIGFALDADGDRLAVIDSDGNYIDNNYILALVYYYLVVYEKRTGDSVKNVATSNLLDVVTKKCGYTCHEVPVGFKYVSGKLIETNALVGGESSGGLAMQNHIWGKDSLLSIALCLKIMATLNKPFKDIMQELLTFANNYHKIIKDKQYTYSDTKEKEIKQKLFVDKVIPQHRYEVESTIYSDYIKIKYSNGNWVLIRFSGTEPVLRTFVEADSIKECNALIQDWEELLDI